MTILLVVLGAAVGAPLRYLVDRFVQARHRTVFPWGTFAVNVAGSFLLGLLADGLRHGGVSTAAIALLGTGFCGALTTYSTFGYETVRLAQQRRRRYATANVVASIVAGLGAAYAGPGSPPCGGTNSRLVWSVGFPRQGNPGAGGVRQ